MKTTTLVLMAVILLTNRSTYAQGCSDAGFCMLGSMGPRPADSVKLKHKISFLTPVGIGDEDVFIFTPAIQYERQLAERVSMQAKIAANYAHGNLGSAFGLGDFFLSGIYKTNRRKWNTSITLGTKLPLNQGNLTSVGRSLPMAYQSSLGTIDIITGLSVSDKVWQFSAGWQQPVSGINRNNFLPDYWQGIAEAKKYSPSNDFNRKGDVLVRAARALILNRKLSLTPGLLALYHLNEDTYIDANVSNTPISLVGSKGLTLNLTLAGSWKLSDALTLGFSAGTPLVFRDVRPDGLTRKIVFAPELHWNF